MKSSPGDELTSRRPYFLRAMHEWISDNGQTPHILVDAAAPGTDVPEKHVRDGRIVLNISWSATQGLKISNDAISFEARFSGAPYRVNIPPQAVLGIYARESGQGMLFAPGSGPGDTPPDDDGASPQKQPPRLKVVK